MKVLIVGAGVASIFTAIELLDNGFKGDDITIIEKGRFIEKRKCFVNQNTCCKNCKVCSITHGLAGAGAFSDSKLNFDEYSLVGGDLGEFYSPDELRGYMDKIKDIYNRFGMKDMNIRQAERTSETIELINQMDNISNLRFHDCETLHLGTDNSRIVYKNMQSYLMNEGVGIYTLTEFLDLIEENNKIIGVRTNKGNFYGDKIVFAVGRSGNEHLNKVFNRYNIETTPSKIDIGVRVETTNEVMDKLNRNFYEAKIYLNDRLYNDKCRMFCTNPMGVVAHEKWNTSMGDISTVNGHAYNNKALKTDNTNFALLVTKEFNGLIENPLEDYVYPMIRMANSLAGGKDKVLVQSLEDLRLHRRSTFETLYGCNLKPTLSATSGDISLVLPYRILTTILDSIEILDNVAHGLNDGKNTLLYAPECKFHSNRILIDKYGKTSCDNIYSLGDGSGYTRGIVQAGIHGIVCADHIIKKD